MKTVKALEPSEIILFTLLAILTSLISSIVIIAKGVTDDRLIVIATLVLFLVSFSLEIILYFILSEKKFAIPSKNEKMMLMKKHEIISVLQPMFIGKKLLFDESSGNFMGSYGRQIDVFRIQKSLIKYSRILIITLEEEKNNVDIMYHAMKDKGIAQEIASEIKIRFNISVSLRNDWPGCYHPH